MKGLFNECGIMWCILMLVECALYEDVDLDYALYTWFMKVTKIAWKACVLY